MRRKEDTAELTGVTGNGLPRTLTDAISDRLGFLSAGTTELLRSAALLGTAFSVSDLGAIVGRSCAGADRGPGRGAPRRACSPSRRCAWRSGTR